MREICIKQSESTDHHRRNLSIVELIEEKGMKARAEKRFSYYIFEQTMKGNEKMDSPKKDRHVSIRKTFDDKSGKGEMAYRVIGSFYVVQNLRLFAVVFMHSIKFDMLTKGTTGLAA